MNLLKGLVAGALAGVAASWVMERFQEQWSQRESDLGSGMGGSGGGQEESSTLRAADMVAVAVSGQPVPDRHRETASEAVHYVTGAGVGGLYGLLAEVAPGPTFGLGAAYGAAVALGLDDMVVPALGLSKSAKETPPSEHAYGMASHLVYGLTLEGARRIIRVLL